MIEVIDLVKKYGNHMAVDHLSFTVEKGKIYGFLGPNGAGKSTTMNIMTGYLGATAGKVLIDGHDILEEPETAKRSVGYLPEIPPLYTDMTVMEYLQFAAELKKIPKYEREEAIGQVIELAKLEDVENRLIKNLSKGYKQRVGLAQAVLGMPEIIILDEPTVGLDPKQIIEIRELIRNLSKQHTVILSSHILAEVREVCDYILIISKGKMVASDTPENLEKLWAGSVTIELEIRAKDKEALQVLDKLESVAEWSYKENAEGNLAVEVKVNGTEDIREELSLAFAEERCAILTMKKNQASLEQVFLELTEGNGAEDSEEDTDEEEMSLSDEMLLEGDVEEEDEAEGGEDDASDL
ncbi:MAG: ABC transporter ATP-binding protein [Tyzzerella sp.]|nr:ABC transporter ATP-binding protein [Tyzzerella sp.]